MVEQRLLGWCLLVSCVYLSMFVFGVGRIPQYIIDKFMRFLEVIGPGRRNNPVNISVTDVELTVVRMHYGACIAVGKATGGISSERYSACLPPHCL